MRSVAELLDQKGREVWSVKPDDSVLDALRKMAEKEIGALVVREGERVVGILSERDYARKVILQSRSSKDTPVRDIMTPNVISVDPRKTIDECMVIMTNGRIRHLPVVEEGRLVGIVSIGDLVKETIEEQKFVIRQLESYITQ
ncbi:MAG TPA: CBS domain-containing protein [Thermoanaerobaculia bacterium]|nr:CBS domain-containing protein [Thermoanaerobaculia bacterium]